MTRNLLVRVYLDPKEYETWKNFAAEHHIKYKNDGELVRNLIHQVAYVEKLGLDVYILRDKIKQVKEQLLKKEDIISKLQSTRVQLQEDLDRLKENIEKKRKKKK